MGKLEEIGVGDDLPLSGGGAERPLQAGARVELGEGHPKIDALEHQVAPVIAIGRSGHSSCDDGAAIRPPSDRRAAPGFLNTRDARVGPDRRAGRPLPRA